MSQKLFTYIKPYRTALLVLISALSFTACSSYNSVTQSVAQRITPYRITIVQGNFVPREAAEQLTVGMSREQVKDILGAPLLTDIFHAQRWDYVFYFKRGAKEIVQPRHFIVYFEGDQLVRWTGGEDLPSENELIAAIDGNNRANTRSKQKEPPTQPKNPAPTMK